MTQSLMRSTENLQGDLHALRGQVTSAGYLLTTDPLMRGCSAINEAQTTLSVKNVDNYMGSPPSISGYLLYRAK